MPRKPVDHNDKEARAYNWVLLATFVLLISLMVQAPARVVANFLPPAVRSQFGEWGGTLWVGQVNASIKGMPVQLRWQWKPAAMLMLTAAADVEALTSGSHVQAQVRLGLNGWQVQALKGELAASDAQSFLAGWQLPPQPLTLNDVAFAHRSTGWQQVKGSLAWQGGAMDYVLNGQRQHLNLPAISAALSDQQGVLMLAVQEQAGGGQLATFSLNKAQLESRLTQRLLAYSPNYHGVAEPDTVVITASQPLDSL